MFLDSSRYAKVPTVETVTSQERLVTAIKLRRLPPVAGEPQEVRDRDQLDVISHERYADGTRFWHIADANTELEAHRLTAEIGTSIAVPST